VAGMSHAAAASSGGVEGGVEGSGAEGGRDGWAMAPFHTSNLVSGTGSVVVPSRYSSGHGYWI